MLYIIFYVVYEWITADYYLWCNSSNVFQMVESISVQDSESYSLLICLVFWQLAVAFVKGGIITYQDKEQCGEWTKGKETPAVSRPVHGLFCHLSIFSAAWSNFSNGYDVLPSGMPILQFSACSSGVCQDNLCAAACRAVKVNVGLSISEYHIPMWYHWIWECFRLRSAATKGFQSLTLGRWRGLGWTHYIIQIHLPTQLPFMLQGSQTWNSGLKLIHF